MHFCPPLAMARPPITYYIGGPAAGRQREADHLDRLLLFPRDFDDL
jgi:hypothetical protein